MSDLSAFLTRAGTSTAAVRRGSIAAIVAFGRRRSTHWRPVASAVAATIALALPGAAQEPTAPASSSALALYGANVGVPSAPMRVDVLDGVTFKDVESGGVYRLFGVDACAADQRARLGRQSWPCGAVATAWLVTATLGKWIACNDASGSGGVVFVRCATAEHPDLGLDLLRAGLGVALADEHGRKLRAYADVEAQARKALRGLWASQFELPRAYHEFREGSPTRSPTPAAPATPAAP